MFERRLCLKRKFVGEVNAFERGTHLKGGMCLKEDMFEKRHVCSTEECV